MTGDKRLVFDRLDLRAPAAVLSEETGLDVLPTYVAVGPGKRMAFPIKNVRGAEIRFDIKISGQRTEINPFMITQRVLTPAEQAIFDSVKVRSFANVLDALGMVNDLAMAFLNKETLRGAC